MADYTNWKLERDAAGLAWLTVDLPGTRTNVLSSAVLGELELVLDELEGDPPRGLVIRSGKPAGFIAGADIDEFDRFADPAEATAAIRRAQGILDRLERLPCRTVCLIHGYCLGGGLELALACDHRVAEDEPDTRLGLPEVRLGIHPGFGGSLRMIRTVGPAHGLDAMLTGRSLSARAAQRIGLIDFALPRRHLETGARALAEGATRAPRRRLPWWSRLLNTGPVRPLFAAYLRRRVAARAPREHYPAPYALIDLWAHHWPHPHRMLEAEAASVAQLVRGDTARNLIRVFRLQERLKAQGRESAFRAERVHVIGAGAMGGDIAVWCAAQGLTVTLQDTRAEAIGDVLKRAKRVFERRLKDRRLVRAAYDRLVPDLHGNGLRRADVVIEAIVEDAAKKQALFAAIEPQLREDALLATNTSSIRLETLGTALHRPERLVGLHFFNPVARMPLVEVVLGERTDSGSAARAQAFTRQIDRLPLPVRSTPGFLVNRILMPYLLEAVQLIEEGVPAPAVDRAAVDFGMPMGPVELADTVGLDICLSVADILSRELGGEVPERLRQLVASGRLGKKSAGGFYPFRRGKPDKPSLPKGYTAPEDLKDRLVLRLVNEAVACLREEVVTDADLVDAGVIFGTGFAPFRGGPLHYAGERGSESVLSRLAELQARHGDRFEPDPGWQRLREPRQAAGTVMSE